MQNLWGMDPNLIITEIERYSAATGLKESTVCQRALNNALYLDRLRSRVARLNAEFDRVRTFIAANPPAVPGASIKSEPQHDPASSDPA